MSAAVDHDFATTQAALLALATSAHLARGDLAGFHRQALEELRHLPAEHIVLIDPTGQILLTTRRPFGTQLPRLTSSPLLARRGAGQSDLGAVRAPSPLKSGLLLSVSYRMLQPARRDVGAPVESIVTRMATQLEGSIKSGNDAEDAYHE